MNTNSNNKQNRRTFLNWILGIGSTGLMASIIYPLIRYIIPPETREPDVSSVSLGKIEDYKPNSSKIFKFGQKTGLLLRLKNGDFRAFSATCTHLDCTVQYRKDLKLIWCACHNGKYDLNGNNIGGPPPKPLEEFKVVTKGDEIFVKKEEA